MQVKVVTLRGFTSRTSVDATVEWVVTRRSARMTGLPFPPGKFCRGLALLLCSSEGRRGGRVAGTSFDCQSANCYSVHKHLRSSPCVPGTVLGLSLLSKNFSLPRETCGLVMTQGDILRGWQGHEPGSLFASGGTKPKPRTSLGERQCHGCHVTEGLGK